MKIKSLVITLSVVGAVTLSYNAYSSHNERCSRPIRTGVDLSNCNILAVPKLPEDVLNNILLVNTEFQSNVILNHTIIHDSNLENVNFKGGSEMKGSKVQGNTNLINAKIERSYLQGLVVDTQYVNGASFIDSDLTDAKFINKSINLSGVKLKGATLNNTDLSNIDFGNIDLKEVNLSKAILTNADLRHVKNLNSAVLRASDNNGNGLSGANLNGYKFKDVHYDFSYLKMKDIKLENAVIEKREVSLNHADLTNATANGIKVDEVDASNSIWKGAKLSNSIFGAYVDLTNANLEDATLNGAKFDAHIKLTNANLKNVTMLGSTFFAVSLGNTNLFGIKANGSDFRGSWFDEKTNLVNADLTKVDLRNTNDFKKAILRTKDNSGKEQTIKSLSGADLSGLDLSGLNFKKINISGAVLKGADLTKAKFDDDLYAQLEGVNLSGATWTDGRTCAEGSIGFCKGR